MPKQLHRGYVRRGSAADSPRLSEPVEVGGQHYQFHPTPIDTSAPGGHQPWNGYVPACTLKRQDDCQYVPVQTANIKVLGIYHGIEVLGDDWQRLACDVARESVEHQGGPFGAVILQIDDARQEILRYWANHNQVTSSNDPTAHAEVMAIRSACASLGVFNLGCIKKEEAKLPQPGPTSHCIILSSAEPCPMCYAAICWAALKTLFFAATRFDAAAQGVGFGDEAIYEELARPYAERRLKTYQCTVDNSLDAFNLWKRSEKIPY